MERIAIIALLMFGLNASAQTPFDSFAPEATRPMLEADALHHQEGTRSEVSRRHSALRGGSGYATPDHALKFLILKSKNETTLLMRGGNK